MGKFIVLGVGTAFLIACIVSVITFKRWYASADTSMGEAGGALLRIIGIAILGLIALILLIVGTVLVWV